MIEISFIVPVYNVEKYLRRCVNSILQQSLKSSQFEIILVDDGSPDNCGSICDDYSVCYGNIHTIHQNNRGLSDARNVGITAAKGEFIQFIDSDDYLAENIVPTLLYQIKSQDLDVLRFNYENVNEEERIIRPDKNPKLYVDYSETVTDGLSFLNERLGYACYACQFIIRSTIAKVFPFMVGIHFEDTEWVSRMMPSVRRVSSNPTVAYFYRTRENSITKGNSETLVRKNIDNRLLIIALLQKRKLEVSRTEWFDGMVSHMVLTLLSSSVNLSCCDRNQLLESLKNLEVYPLSVYRMTDRAVRKIHIINFSPRLFCMICFGASKVKRVFRKH